MIMEKIIRKSWRDSAALIILAKRNGDLTAQNNACLNYYNILLQTRTVRASFPNSVVFPGGVTEPNDNSHDWLHLFKSFGYTNKNFETFHYPGASLTPIFQTNPVERHIALRITAIRETFEELGLLICSRECQENRNSPYASIISDVDIKYWQNKVSEDPKELLNLCREYKCYPDIWSLHYWSNWLSPIAQPKRFDSAFFITVLESRPPSLRASNEVTNVQWLNPSEILDRNKNNDLQLYPPQAYEISRLSHWCAVDELIKFASEKSCRGNDLLYPVAVQAKDGTVHLLPGDSLYPLNLDYNSDKLDCTNKTVLELRNNQKTLHRTELSKSSYSIVIKNYKPNNHINMGDSITHFRTQMKIL